MRNYLSRAHPKQRVSILLRQPAIAVIFVLLLGLLACSTRKDVRDSALVGEWIAPEFKLDDNGIVFRSDGSGDLLTTNQGPRTRGPGFRWRTEGADLT